MNKLLLSIAGLICMTSQLLSSKDLKKPVKVSLSSSHIAYPSTGGTIDQKNPIIVGIVDLKKKRPLANGHVVVYLDGKAGAVVNTNSDGVWSYKVSPQQTFSNLHHHTIAAAGLNNDIFAGTSYFYLDAKNKEVMRSGNVDAQNSSIAFPEDGAFTDSNQPTVVGVLADSNDNPVDSETVSIIIDGNQLGTTSSDSNGVFSYTLTPDQALADGSHTASAYAQESMVFLSSTTFTVDTTPPDAPTVTFPTDGSTVDSSTVIVTGTTEDNAAILIFLDGDTGGEITYADESGNWSLELDDLDNGSHTLQAQAIDEALNEGPISSLITFTVSA
ncbi:MAG TPA: Ig-like domain-containing protein [Candidatus Babeliaceae bacterium]|nr:Ig-like domain-containing protein [Candidatus Babeliaceae bacterium]